MQGLDLSGTIMEEVLKDAPIEVHQSIRSYLGSFLFSGDDVFKKTGVLSGGEKTRLVMLKTMLNPSNLLILDEPTYHLDKDSVEAIRQAITTYRGTIIFVTHDRDLIASFADRILELKSGVLRDYPGDYDYYLWKRDEKAVPAKAKLRGGQDRNVKETPANRIKRLILDKEVRRNKLRDAFSRPGMAGSPRKAKKLFEEYQRLADEIEALEKELAAAGAE
jgi:ATP-binding cassette subfamily F protein 3